MQTTALARNRAEQLFSNNVAPKSQLEQAELGYEQAVSARDSARSALAEAKNQVAYADLKSDLSGIVTAVAADVGQVVGSGTPVVTVAVDGEKEVQIAVPEMDIAQFKPGKVVKARFWSDAALVLGGKVREVAGSADPQSRTFTVRVSLPHDPRVLARHDRQRSKPRPRIPPSSPCRLSALAEKDGAQIVWVVDRKADTVHARPIKTGAFSDDGVRVSAGLKPGDLVVAAGTQFMTENMKVKLPSAAGEQAAAAETGDQAASGVVR